MGSLEAAIRMRFDLLQYVAFFGAFVVLGLLELAGAPQAGRRRRWPANIGLTILNILLLGAMPVSAVAAADLAMARGWGLLNRPEVPVAAAVAIGFVLRSLVSYGVHVAMHKLPLFWRLHRVHHTDVALDVSTTVRFHPLEFAIALPVQLAATALLGLPPLAVMFYELFDAGMAVFTHANIRLPGRVERLLGWVLVTPAMHRLHHSTWQPETDSNYGATFSWWDRLFGTYRMRPPAELAALQLGLSEVRDGRTDSMLWLLALPLRRLDPAAPR